MKLILLLAMMLRLTGEQRHPRSSDTQRYGNVINDFLPPGYRWPNATIPYSIDGTFDEPSLVRIKSAMQTITNVSCVKFTPRNQDEPNFVSIVDNYANCWADTGRQPQQTTILSLSSDCIHDTGTIIHELMHTLGFLHQHTRPDRDLHVEVLYDNIKPDPLAVFNYEIVQPWTELAFPLPYDPTSIMHYTPAMFSKDPARLPTMVLRSHLVVDFVGQRNHLSDYDILSINFLYCV